MPRAGSAGAANLPKAVDPDNDGGQRPSSAPVEDPSGSGHIVLDAIRIVKDACDPYILGIDPGWRCMEGIHIYDPESEYMWCPRKLRGSWVRNCE